MLQDQSHNARKNHRWVAIILGSGCLAMVLCVSIVVLGSIFILPEWLSSSGGESFEPAWSPDGSLIAFNSTRDSGDDIYIMQSDGANVVRLTTRSAFFGFFKYSRYPAWSPDGKQLAFVSNRSGHDEIYIMNSDGSHVLQLTDSPAEGREGSGGFGAFDWSPNGQRIVFLMSKGKIVYGDPSVPQPTEEIYVVNVDGTHLTRLTDLGGDIGQPQWSPDDSRIAFSFAEKHTVNTDGSSRNHDIYVMNADGTNMTRLTNLEGSAWAPRWSPDGNKIVFASDNKQTDIYVMEADGTNLTQLTDDEASEGDLAWSPDGTRILFTSGEISHNNVYIMNADGTGIKRLTSTSGLGDSAPCWSPDGHRIAFDTNDPETHVNDIFIIEDDGSNLVQLTDN